MDGKPYLAENRAEQTRLTRALSDAEGELNDEVYLSSKFPLPIPNSNQ